MLRQRPLLVASGSSKATCERWRQAQTPSSSAERLPPPDVMAVRRAWTATSRFPRERTAPLRDACSLRGATRALSYCSRRTPMEPSTPLSAPRSSPGQCPFLPLKPCRTWFLMGAAQRFTSRVPQVLVLARTVGRSCPCISEVSRGDHSSRSNPFGSLTFCRQLWCRPGYRMPGRPVDRPRVY